MSKETQLIAENMVERLNLRQWPLVYTGNVIYAIPPEPWNALHDKAFIIANRTKGKDKIKDEETSEKG